MKPLLLFFLFCAVFCKTAQSQPSAQKPTLVLATYPYDQNNRLENLQPLAHHLEQTLQQAVRAVSYPTVSALLAAIRAREVDVALVNTYGFLLLSTDTVPVVRPLASLVVPEGQTTYQACLFSSRSSGIQSMEDLRERAAKTRIVLAGENSTSGNYAQRQFLQQARVGALEKAFAEVQYAQSHAQVIQLVNAGLAEVGACGLNELRHQLQNWQVHPEEINVLWTSGQIPLGPVVVQETMPQATQKKIQQALTQLHVQNPAAFKSVLEGWTEAGGASNFRACAPGPFSMDLKKSAN
ncbi:phosphate/phosphite/phosphonate ABC transporter substrate-binding protein [Rufibacter latericius]|uniref:Phosphate/phosphite/phosphonate ABC transporter substrate-binding protein n=1 Tax=Rufibacter latericius TaxID=2487040 RepID=A0A3M9MTL0_9BACT|nr:phosphate/phosphite/phosphonate ABC transporter substrate-binding protein [Rufibacter latericius]RNI28864.1 phosphate/phosphite/phosphonate ABC transporter substrate-binding protein [Rufibacter latericius]